MPRAFAAASWDWVMPIPPERPPIPPMPPLPPIRGWLSRVPATLSACAWVRVPSVTRPLSALLMWASLLVTTLPEVVAEAGVYRHGADCTGYENAGEDEIGGVLY